MLAYRARDVREKSAVSVVPQKRTGVFEKDRKRYRYQSVEIYEIVFILCSARSNFEGSALGCINEKSEADSHLRAREDAASTLTRHGAARPGMAHRRVFTSIKENTSLKRDDYYERVRK